MWQTTSWESLNISSDSTFISLASFNPTIKALYSASLLEALNLNLRAQCIQCPSGLMSIKSAPDPPSFDAPSTSKPHFETWGVDGLGPFSGRSSSLWENLAMKSTRACPLTAVEVETRSRTGSTQLSTSTVDLKSRAFEGLSSMDNW